MIRFFSGWPGKMTRSILPATNDMLRLVQYFGQFQTIRGSVGGMPRWSRILLLIVALPGILLVALSILVFLVSVLALLLLTVPVYRMLKWLTDGGARQKSVDLPSGRRHIDVKIVE